MKMCTDHRTALAFDIVHTMHISLETILEKLSCAMERQTSASQYMYGGHTYHRTVSSSCGQYQMRRLVRPDLSHHTATATTTMGPECFLKRQSVVPRDRFLWLAVTSTCDTCASIHVHVRGTCATTHVTTPKHSPNTCP